MILIFERLMLLIGDWLIPLLVIWALWHFWFRKILLTENRKEQLEKAEILKEFVEEEAEKIKKHEIKKETFNKNKEIKTQIKKGEELSGN